jgi:hypothetical protein
MALGGWMVREYMNMDEVVAMLAVCGASRRKRNS